MESTLISKQLSPSRPLSSNIWYRLLSSPSTEKRLSRRVDAENEQRFQLTQLYQEPRRVGLGFGVMTHSFILSLKSASIASSSCVRDEEPVSLFVDDGRQSSRSLTGGMNLGRGNFVVEVIDLLQGVILDVFLVFLIAAVDAIVSLLILVVVVHKKYYEGRFGTAKKSV